MVTLARRKVGFIVKSGNPLNIQSITDLARPDIRFINRQAGSGTRVYLDSLLQQSKIVPTVIQGYGDERSPILKSRLLCLTHVQIHASGWKPRPELTGWISFISL